MTENELFLNLQSVKQASLQLINLSEVKKNKILQDIAKLLLLKKETILRENAKDIENAKINGLSNAMIERLALDDAKLLDISMSVKA
ncbi:MAG: gamma-glutamyl-phosphate reductase, partial [Dialister micraerophilus]|nr:gamma-glutamyl-phosphate reductase [Dialister micraerophilus]